VVCSDMLEDRVHSTWMTTPLELILTVLSHLHLDVDLFLRSTITSISDSFSPICAHAWNYSQGCNQYKCMTWLNVTGCYSVHGNGCNLLMEIVVYND
jgi:hypothetical protein